MPGLTLRSPSDGESEGTALSVGSCGFQRSLTRCRWLLDPLLLELTSQVETDQPLLSCDSIVRRWNRSGPMAIPAGVSGAATSPRGVRRPPRAGRAGRCG